MLLKRRVATKGRSGVARSLWHCVPSPSDEETAGTESANHTILASHEAPLAAFLRRIQPLEWPCVHQWKEALLLTVCCLCAPHRWSQIMALPTPHTLNRRWRGHALAYWGLELAPCGGLSVWQADVRMRRRDGGEAAASSWSHSWGGPQAIQPQLLRGSSRPLSPPISGGGPAPIRGWSLASASSGGIATIFTCAPSCGTDCQHLHAQDPTGRGPWRSPVAGERPLGAMCSCEPVVAGASPLCPRLIPTKIPPSPAPTLTASAHRRLRPHRRPWPPSPIIACAAVACTAVFRARTFRARLYYHSLVPASLVGSAGAPPAAASGWRSCALDSARFSCPRLGSTFGRGGSGLAPAPPTSFCSPLAPSFCDSGWPRPC